MPGTKLVAWDKRAILELLASSGLSRVGLADYLGVHPGTVDRWCIGQVAPDIRSQRALNILAEKLDFDRNQVGQG